MLVKLPRGSNVRGRGKKRRPTLLNRNPQKFLQKELNRKICAIETLKGQVTALERKCLEVRDRILEEKRFRQRKGGLSAVSIERKRQHNALKLLSEQVQSVKRKTSLVAARSQELKGDIDHLRQERLGLQNVRSRIQTEFEEKKRSMKQILQQANNYYVARQVAARRETTLKRHQVFEKEAFHREWASLGRQITAHSAVQESIGTAHLQRTVATLRKQIEANKHDAEKVGRLKGELHAVKAKVAKSAVHGQEGEVRFSSADKAFQKIHRETGVVSVGDVVEQFISTEDEVFALFNHIQEFHEQNSELNAKLEHLEKEIDASIENSSGAKLRREIMKDNEKKLKQVKEKFEKATTHHAKQREAFTRAKAIVERLCYLFGEPILNDIVGESVSPSNVMTCLGEVEKRTGEALVLLQKQKFANKRSRRLRHGAMRHTETFKSEKGIGQSSEKEEKDLRGVAGIQVELEESDRIVELLQVSYCGIYLLRFCLQCDLVS